MTDPSNKKNVSNKDLLVRYAAIGTQILAALLVGVFLGKWIDAKLQLSFPILIWLLPLVLLLAMLLKVVRDTSKKNNE